MGSVQGARRRHKCAWIRTVLQIPVLNLTKKDGQVLNTLKIAVVLSHSPKCAAYCAVPQHNGQFVRTANL